MEIKDNVQSKNYKGIALSCGSAGGYAQLGALHYFYSETNALKDCKYFAGASVGAAISGFLAIGYKPVEIFAELVTNDVNEIFELNLNLMNIFSTWGLVENEKFKAYIENMIIKKYNKVPTLKEIYEETGNIVTTVSYCLSQNKSYYFNYKSFPDMPLSTAIVLSCNIPVLFEKAEYGGEIYIDGAIFDRCPAIWLKDFIKKDSNINDFSILVLDLFSPSQQKRNEIKRFIDYVTKIGLVFLDSQTKPQTDEILDVIKVTNDFSDFTLKVEKQQKFKAFTSSLNETKKQFTENPKRQSISGDEKENLVEEQKVEQKEDQKVEDKSNKIEKNDKYKMD